MLRRAARSCTALTAPPDGFIADTFVAARAQLGICRRVTLLLDEKRTIPVVWGVFRPRLLLPAEAREWNEEQLRSVLLHELAHIRRRDALVQWITQIACALHWFNPLVWLAAWRLHAERERACDDLVLASGVRPSAYAEHLLYVATNLSPAPWTAACGLAMARKSSLEGRLLAVLSKKLNRRSVTRILIAATMVFAAAVVIPLAMLRAAGADKPKADTAAVKAEPKDPGSKALFENWKTSARSDGKIPGGRIGEMAASLKSYMDLNAGTEAAEKCESVLKKCDAAHDWTPAEAAALLDEIEVAAPSRAEWAMRTNWQEMIAARVMQQSPMPAAAADREQLLRRVMQDFPGTVPTADEIAALIADNAPDALTRLITSLQARAAAMHFAGELSGGETKFRVIAGGQKKDEPKQGAQIKPATEQKLKWGEPANGLRMALAWPPTLGEPGMGEAPEFYLVVQNVSDAAVRFTANDAAPNPRRLMMRDKGSPLQGLRDPMPMPGDWLMQPREVAFVRLFQKEKDGHITSAAIEDNIRAFPHYSMTAEMSIEKAPAGAWTGKLSTGETRGSADVIPPKNKFAQGLYKSWTTASRTDGKIPGALIGKLAETVKTFIKGNPTRATTPPLEKMLPRFDATRDWSGPDAVALLDELAAVQDLPIIEAHEHETAGIVHTGIPLSAELGGAPWGEARPNGLRMAWWLEPRGAEHRLGTPLKSHILIHNAGKETVVFRTRGWHHVELKARDAKGSDIKVESVTRGIHSLVTVYRLAPGESLFIERPVPAIGIGAIGIHEYWQNTHVASWIEAKAGDEVTVTGTVPLHDWNDQPDILDGEPRWWLDFITARLSRHLPFPADKDGRERLLYRIAMELFGTPVSEEINAAFVADRAPNALDSLALRLHHRPGLHAWAGPLISGPTKFLVLPADPDAAKKPRTASNPGQYTLNENATLVVTRRPGGERVVNDAEIRFGQPEPEASRPPGPFKLKLPDGYNTWAAAWIRGGTVMWVAEKGLLRKIDFTNPAKLEETRFEAADVADAPIPPDIREALRDALTVPDAPKQQYVPLTPPPADAAPASEAPKTEKPKGGADAKPTADGYAKSGVPVADLDAPMTWSGEQNGLCLGMSIAEDADWRIGKEVKVALWVCNPGGKDVKFENVRRNDLGLRGLMTGKDGKEHAAAIAHLYLEHQIEKLLLPAGHVVKVREFSVVFSPPEGAAPGGRQPRFTLPPGEYKFRCEHDLMWTVINGADGKALKPAADVWTGLLKSGEVDVKLIGVDAPKQQQEPLNPNPAAAATDTKQKGSDFGRAEEELEKGQTAVETGDRKAALSHFLRAVELDPNCAEAHSNLAVLYSTEDPPKLNTARSHYEKATALGRPRETGLDKLFGISAAPAASETPKTEKPKFSRGTEEKLEWGEAVNGLRMALAWPPTLGEPAAGEVPDFFLAVQNVSEAPARLCTTPEAPNKRRLTFSTDGRIQSRFVSSEPNGADVTLGPREVVFLRLFMESANDPESVLHGSMIASAVRQGPGVRLLADMEIAQAPAGTWTGTLVTPWTRAGVGAEAPKNRKAQELFKVWLQHTRVNGKIPGGHIARLGDRVKEFVRANTGDKSGDPYAKKMEPFLSRLDGARDWQPAEASALLNDVAAVSDVPLSVMLEETAGGTIQYSLTLKPALESAPWGEALPNGLRVACLLEPRAAEHRLGTPLKMRILVHNAGNEPVVVRTRTWHHIEPTAHDAKGAEIKMESVTSYTRPPLVAYRLVPGRFIELASPGLGIGRYGFHDFKDADIATWIGASEGDEVTLTPGPVPLNDWNEASVLDGEPRWWLDFIAARLSLANPLPADAAERTALLKSTVRELFHNDATAEEIAAFVADREPNALDSLAKRLAHRPGLNAWAGSLTSGTTKFRVTAADPNGAKPAATPAPPASAGKPKPGDAAKPAKEDR